MAGKKRISPFMGIPYRAKATPSFSLTCAGCGRKERFPAKPEEGKPDRFALWSLSDSGAMCPVCIAKTESGQNA